MLAPVNTASIIQSTEENLSTLSNCNLEVVISILKGNGKFFRPSFLCILFAYVSPVKRSLWYNLGIAAAYRGCYYANTKTR